MATPVGPVVYAIFVNGVSIPDLPLDSRLCQAWGQHDLFAVRIEYNRLFPMSTIQQWADNATVQIVWGRRPGQLQTWYGYVNHSEQSSHADSGTQDLQYTYYCIGTSKPMNTVTSMTWGSVSPTYIAKQMAAKYHLRCVFSTTTTVLTNETQANMSDFNYMNALADKTGYRFWVSGGTLYFLNPTDLITNTSRQAVPQFVQNKSLTQQDTMRKFQVLQGDNLPGSTVATRTITGIDQTSGHLFTATTGSGSVTLPNTTRVATSLGQAQSIIEAQADLSQFFVGATAELYGNTLIYPGKIIFLTGTALPGGNIGYWLVVSAKQILLSSGTGNPSNDKYVTQVVIMRNTMATVPALNNTVILSPEFVPCAVSNGQWFSSSQAVIANGVING
jgi:hypothetical protein